MSLCCFQSVSNGCAPVTFSCLVLLSYCERTGHWSRCFLSYWSRDIKVSLIWVTLRVLGLQRTFCPWTLNLQVLLVVLTLIMWSMITCFSAAVYWVVFWWLRISKNKLKLTAGWWSCFSCWEIVAQKTQDTQCLTEESWTFPHFVSSQNFPLFSTESRTKWC